MGFLGFGKKEVVLSEAPPCPHGVLVPRWDSVADMGIAAKATRYMCDACHQEFTPDEAETMRTKLTEVLIAQDTTTDEAKAAIESEAEKES